MMLPALAAGCESSVAAPAPASRGGPDIPPPAAPPGDVVAAFPGAEGWGATALNASRRLPLRTHQVTNLESTGPGSLQSALAQSSSEHFDVIMFRVGGRIEAPEGEGFRLDRSHVYLAGQTAPGGGIVIQGTGTSFWFRGSGPNISDVVFRHLRFRGRGGQTNNNLIIAKGTRIVLDHLSFSWSDNYLFAALRYDADFSAPISNISVQNSIFSEVFGGHPTASQLATDNALGTDPEVQLGNLSFHRNLFAHNSHRNPNSAADNIALINNVLYNWNQGTMQLVQRGVADFVSNIGKAGPMTRTPYTYMINPRCDPDRIASSFEIFAAGNVGPMSGDATGDNWSGASRQVACYYRSGGYDGQKVPPEWRRDEPQGWADIPFPVSVRSAYDAFEVVLEDVGANARLSCDGRWVAAVDVVDARVIDNVWFRTGPSRPIPHERSVGPLPDYPSGPPCPDRDGDGLPDEWERRYFGCSTCADPAAMGGNGYLVVEHYLNGTDPR